MSKHIEGFGGMALELAEIEIGMFEMLQKGLGVGLARIEATAKAEIGTYQPAAGAFPAWAELADATKADRVAQGYSENDPLERTGEMRDSIEHEQGILEGVVGSTDPKMLFHEQGTSKMPPRPVLGPALFRNIPLLQKLAGAAVSAGFIGAHELPAELGYAHQIED